MKIITNREINVSPNISKQTFTIRVEGAKYRTTKMNKEEFESCLHNTGNDWQQFLKSSDYYKV
jgi:arsenate reductase-like glutaredoxin family protein